MKKVFYFFIGIIMLLSCQQTAIDKPDNLIEEDTMEDILYDLAILDAIKTNNPASLDRRNISAPTYVYDKYDIDSLQFASSNHYYAADVHNYLKMYQRVEERLTAEKKQIDTVISQKKNKQKDKKLQKTDSTRLDSIKRKRLAKKLELNN